MTEKSSLLAVIRVRGRVKVRKSIDETLSRLRLRRVNNLVLVDAKNASYVGMVKKCKDFVTFGEVDQSVLAKLLKEKGMDEKSVAALLSGEKMPKDLGMRMPIRMHPPRHGYEAVKKDYKSGGSLGYRSTEINKLILRML